jgi:hypothetical protein
MGGDPGVPDNDAALRLSAPRRGSAQGDGLLRRLDRAARAGWRHRPDCPYGPAGFDLIAHTDPLDTTGPRIKVQVKRRDTEKVSAESLRAFMAVLGDQDVGIYISAAGFSSQAEREARSQEKRRLKLIDLERFVELWVQHMHGVSDSDRRRLPLKPVYFLDSALE